MGDTTPINIDGTAITKQYLLTLTIDERKEQLIKVMKYYRDYGFPYPKYDDNTILRDFSALKDFDTNTIIDGDRLRDSTAAGLKVFKHFCPQIYDVYRGNKPSMVQAFNNDSILKKCLENRMGISYMGINRYGQDFIAIFNITNGMIRQGLRNGYFSSQVSIFKPAIAKAIYDKYTKENDIVYDFSIGFGQRLAGALSCKNNLKYIGCDPWDKCVNEAREIGRFFGRENDVVVEQAGSEVYCPEEFIGKVSLAFSSPPYFNMEVYDNNNSTQAYSGGMDYFVNVWFDKTLENMSKLLKEDGIIALNIPQNIFAILNGKLKNYNFEVKTVLYVQLTRNAKFHVKESKTKLEPIYIIGKSEPLIPPPVFSSK
ncbi:MAG: hypothetical protein ACOYMA_00500 [Bacteroidia bacterium]